MNSLNHARSPRATNFQKVSKTTDIDLFGIASPYKTATSDMPLGPFHSKGKILSLLNKVMERGDSRSYVVVAEDEQDSPAEWLAIKFQMPLTADRASGLKVAHEVLKLTESPTTDETRYLKETSVRFYKGKLNGQQATLIFYAERDFSGLPAIGSRTTPTTVFFSLFELQSDIVNLPGLFVRVARFRSAKKYCNTDLALWRELVLPMPSNYSTESNDDINSSCKN